MSITIEKPITLNRWPGITFFNDSAEKRLEEVASFLEGLEATHPDVAPEIRDAFIQKMDSLNEYGGKPGDPDKRFRVELGWDSVAYSFSICWYHMKSGTFFMNGGLIWHGGGNETYTVSLTPQWWGIHT